MNATLCYRFAFLTSGHAGVRPTTTSRLWVAAPGKPGSLVTACATFSTIGHSRLLRLNPSDYDALTVAAAIVFDTDTSATRTPAAPVTVGASTNRKDNLTVRLIGGIILAFCAAFAWGVYQLNRAPSAAALVVDGIPARALTAYRAAVIDAPCTITWQAVAAIGFIESGHGTHGGSTITADGTTVPPIYGLELNGTGPQQHATIGPSGKWDKAAGPMQFTFNAWQQYGVDGDHDGKIDAQDIDDAAPATAKYLCALGWAKDPTEAYGRYNAGEDWAGGEGRKYAAAVAAYIRNLPDVGGTMKPIKGRDAAAVLALMGDEMSTRWSHFGVLLGSKPGTKLDTAHAALTPLVDVLADTLNPSKAGSGTVCDRFDVARMKTDTVTALRQTISMFGCPMSAFAGRPIFEGWRDPKLDSMHDAAGNPNGAHPDGRSFDLSSSDPGWMRKVAEWLTAQPSTHCVIHARYIWQRVTGRWLPYVGDGPHDDHVHATILINGKAGATC